MGRWQWSTSSDQAPSDEDIKQFVLSFKSFLERAEATSSQATFGDLLKEISTATNTIAQKNGVLYPTELAKLVATFVPVLGNYMPHNSKVVVVDMENRLAAMEKHQKAFEEHRIPENFWKTGATISVLSTVVGTIVYWPFTIHRLEFEDKSLTEKLEDEKKKVINLELEDKRLTEKLEDEKKKVVNLELKVHNLEQNFINLDASLSQLEDNCAASATSQGEDDAWTIVCASAAGVGVGIACVFAYMWLK